jgi:nucleotide-binding universal stress UspA family protein
MSLFRTILVPADFSERSRGAFRMACSLARDEATRLVVVHVVEPPPVMYGELGMPVSVDFGDLLDRESLTRQLRETYVPDHAVRAEYQVREGVPAEEILQLAEETDSRLIVMGTHGRTGLGRLLAGSVAEAVMRRARCPVLTVRSPFPEQAEAPVAPTPAAAST